MSIGALVAQLLSGTQDPRAQLLAAAQGGAPAAGAVPPQGPGTGGGDAGPATTGAVAGQQPPAGPGAAPGSAPPNPNLPASPPDLATLYTQLIEQQRRADGFDRGITTMAAGFSRYNRAGLMQQANSIGGGGGGSGGGADSAVKTIMEIQKAQAAAQVRAQLQSTLPALSKQLGLPEEQIGMLFESGQLPDLMKTLAVPDNEIRELKDGRTVVINKRSGHIIQDLGGKAERGVDLVEGPNGEKIRVDAITKQPLGGDPVTGPKERQFDDQTMPDGSVRRVDKITRLPVEGEAPIPKPDEYDTQTLPDGSQVRVNKRTRLPVEGEAPIPKPKTYNPTATKDGGIIAVDPQDPTKSITVREPTPDAPHTPDTIELDRVNRERTAAGEKTLSMEEWAAKQNREKNPSRGVGSQAIGQQVAKSYGDAVEGAKSASAAIESIRSANDAMDRGVIQGNKFSPYVSEGRKVLAGVFGIEDDEKTVNTDKFNSQMKQLVMQEAKNLGTGNSISNADVETATKAVGSQEMSKDSVQSILRVREQANRKKIALANRRSDELGKHDDELKGLVETIPMPLPSNNLLKAHNVSMADYEALASDPSPENYAAFDSHYGKGTAEVFLGLPAPKKNQ